MMRLGHLFERVASFGALCAAGRRAVRGKRDRESAAWLLFHLEREACRVERELLDGTWRPRGYRTFTVSDPKPRTISAADIRDRMVHHALCAVLEPVFERVAVFDSYACRRGKGSHAAVRRVHGFARRFGWFAKLDVRKYFETIPHDALKTQVRRLLKDRRLLDLLDRIIDHGAPGSAPGRGLPIGNLTSQHLANLYLAPLDHFAKERLRVPGYVRYMDDCLLFGRSRADVRGWAAEVGAFAEGPLGLEIKTEATVTGPVGEGVPFLGFRVWPGVVRLDGTGRRRLVRRLRAATRDGEGRRDGGEHGAFEARGDSVRSVVAHAAHAGTLQLRRSVLGRVARCWRGDSLDARVPRAAGRPETRGRSGAPKGGTGTTPARTG